jgi:hypothetical protein
MTELIVASQAVANANRETGKRVRFFPREHGATAMLFTPLVCAAILARAWRWSEVAVAIAAFSALAAKDPMVVLARQRYVWKRRHEESADAARWFAGWMVLLTVSGLVLLATWPLKATLALGLGVGAFSALAIRVNVRNKQRSTLFQIASALALTSSSLAVCLSATGGIARWCWALWLLMALQATTGILVVHARLDARIAARKPTPASNHFSRAAYLSLSVLLCVAIFATITDRLWITFAMMVAAAGYQYDLHEQRNVAKLQMPLARVGQRALALSCFYAGLLIFGLW